MYLIDTFSYTDIFNAIRFIANVGIIGKVQDKHETCLTDYTSY